jgi:hypothetical protein
MEMISKLMQESNTATTNLKKLMDHLLGLPSCTLITTGRTGTDFLQSLLDSHTEVLTFNGSLWFYEFWEDSYCAKVPDINLDHLLDEFLGKHIQKFKSRYDWEERKDRLGENAEESIDINFPHFKEQVKAMLCGRTINTKNVLLAVYGSYSLCLGQDIEKKNIFFHHIHHAEKLPPYLKDFPDSKIICMTRDPRANFVSGVQHWRKYDQNSDNGGHLYYYIKRILLDAYVLEQYNNDYVVLRIEDLGEKQILEKLCAWLSISYTDELTMSTWGGKRWRGDRLSTKENEVSGWSAKMLDNSWDKKLSLFDKFLFNFLMNSRLKFYNYPYRENDILDCFTVPILILLPLSFELRYFSYSYIREAIKNKEMRKVFLNYFSYLQRIILFYKYYAMVIRRFKFARKFIRRPQ